MLNKYRQEILMKLYHVQESVSPLLSELTDSTALFNKTHLPKKEKHY